jgi:uncharacterized protein YqjF (DUF2071 family)
MINYEVDPVVLRPFVPRGTEIDLWNGRTFLSVVGFQFLDTRVHGLAIPGHRNFLEVNLRFYLRREQPGELRRGVAFIQELVPRRAIAWVARWLYNENYIARPMKGNVQIADPPSRPTGAVAYRWRAGGRWHTIESSIAGEPSLAEPGTEPWFISEHYWGYASQRNGTTVEYQVEHPPWSIWEATNVVVDPHVATYYGSPFTDALRQPASSAFVADGSEVSVFSGEPLKRIRPARG